MKYLFIFFIISNSTFLFADQWYWGCNPDNDIINAFDNLDTECEKFAFLDSLYISYIISTNGKYNCRKFNDTISEFLTNNVIFKIKIEELDSLQNGVIKIADHINNINPDTIIAIKIDTSNNLYKIINEDSINLYYTDFSYYTFAICPSFYTLKEKYYVIYNCKILHTISFLFIKLPKIKIASPLPIPLGHLLSNYIGIIDDFHAHIFYLMELKKHFGCQKDME